MHNIDYYTYMSTKTDDKAIVEDIKRIDKERMSCDSKEKETKLMYEQMLKGLWLQQNPYGI